MATIVTFKMLDTSTTALKNFWNKVIWASVELSVDEKFTTEREPS